MPGRQILRGGLTARAMTAVPLESDMFRIHVIDVQDRAQPGACRFGIQPRLVPRRRDCLTACLSPQLPFRGHIEIDTLDLVSSGRNHVDQQLLHVIEISGLNGKRRLTFIAKELALGPETPRTLKPQPGRNLST